MVNFAIKTNELKAIRKAKVVQFVSKYGRGDKGLTQAQKQARIGKLLDTEADKVIGLGENKGKGTKLMEKRDFLIPTEDAEGMFNNIPKEVTNNLDKYPKDIRAKNYKGNHDSHRIIKVEIKDDGSMNYEGIILDGKENNPSLRCQYAIATSGDKDHAKFERRKLEQGKINEVSDRTMAIHEENGDLDVFLEHPDIDTEEDKEMRY